MCCSPPEGNRRTIHVLEKGFMNGQRLGRSFKYSALELLRNTSSFIVNTVVEVLA